MFEESQRNNSGWIVIATTGFGGFRWSDRCGLSTEHLNPVTLGLVD
ncbi:hypothetical protein [Chryseobacterium wanjuense]